MVRLERSVKKQSDYRVKSVTLSAGGTGSVTFDVPSNQVWRVYKVIVEAPPLVTVTIKYKEELTGNTVSMDSRYAYESPFEFKKTATDQHLVITEDRSLTVEMNNPYGASVTPEVKIEFLKMWEE